MRIIRFVTSLLLVVFAAQLAFGGTPIRDYEARVKREAEEVERIRRDSDYDEEGLDAIKRLVSRYEQVDAGGQTITTDNTWLYVLLDSYASDQHAKERPAILSEAGGRLTALDKQLVAYEESLNPAADQSGSNGELGARREQLRRILDRPEYREKPEDPITKFVRDLLKRVYEFFGNLLQRLFRIAFGAAGESSWLFRGLIIAALAGVLVLAFVLLAQIIAKRKKEIGKKDKRLVLGEALDAQLTSRDLAEAAFAAARLGEFRSAVRKLYVALLYQFSEKGLIELRANATNRDYLAMLSNSSLLASPMRYLTDRFDYYWYGMRPISEQDYASYLARYEEASGQAGKESPQLA